MLAAANHLVDQAARKTRQSRARQLGEILMRVVEDRQPAQPPVPETGRQGVKMMAVQQIGLQTPQPRQQRQPETGQPQQLPETNAIAGAHVLDPLNRYAGRQHFLPRQFRLPVPT